MRKICIGFICGLLSACAGNYSRPIPSPQIVPTELSNVSYASVTDLNYEPAQKKLAYGEGPLQYGLLWLPKAADPTDPVPLVIFVHGGCWLNSYDISHSNPLSSALSKEGFAVWSLEYRRSGDPGGGWPSSLNDVLSGVSFAQSFNDFPIDLTRVVLAGHSAGGHLALLAGANDRQVFAEPKGLIGVVGLAAINDMVAYSQGENSCQSASIGFMGGDSQAKPAAYIQANPLQQELHSHSVLLQGDSDNIVPVSQATESNIAFRIIPGAGHFDWLHPQTHAYQVFLLQLQDLLN